MNEYPYGSDMGHGSSNMTGFFMGALVGAGLALLLAPASGGDVRRRLVDTARRFGDTAREKMDEVTHHSEQGRGSSGGRESYMQGREGGAGVGGATGSKPGQQGGRPGTPGQPT
ncbi:MAG TPA: YtxH domain-containing protein [Candidatus Eisenbacteria bacterium]|nr:YtxH domain-containing protein [Candidatus Eisenbacteria bacterium]